MASRTGLSEHFSAAILIVALLSCKCRADTNEIFTRTAEMTRAGSSLVSIPQELEIPSSVAREFRILSGSEYAKVDNRTGFLTVAKPMDREKLCPDNRPKCIVDVTVVVRPLRKRTSPTSLRIVKVQIEVTDINDNTPKFENPVIEKQISEGVDIATPLRLDSAVDPDLGINSIQRYALRSVSGSKAFEKFFKLSVINNIDGTKIPQLELRRNLDREKQAVHTLILEAVDGGTPAKTGTATVRINVTDSNDNSPSFAKDVYVVKVDEHAKNGSLVIQVHADDKDTGLNGKVKYTFPSVVSAEDKKVFALNRETGEITVKNGKKLDYEAKDIYHLTVEAVDMGPNSASDYTTVTVQVQDVNDNKPEVDVSFVEMDEVVIGDSEYDAIIREDIDVGTYLAFVTISDKDQGQNGTVSCEVRNNDVFDLQSLEEDTSRYLLKLVGRLDREEKSVHDVYVHAWDHGNPPQRRERIVRIKVGDINDNAPTFIHPEYSVGVSETAPKDSVVMTLQAKDLDESPGPNSQITYTLLDSGGAPDDADFSLMDLFSIHPRSGKIRLIKNNVLDAETVREPGYLTVLASDNGKPKLNTTTKVKITVIDENDNDPVFKDASYVFHIEEHSNDGFYLGQVQATDADWDKETNGMVIYSVQRYDLGDGDLYDLGRESENGRDSTYRNLEEDRWLQMFQIDRKTGYLHFYGNKTKLDREARNGRPITIMAVASDNGSPERKATARVDIFLTDINDNAPTVIFPDVTKDIAFVQIRNDQPDIASLVEEPESGGPSAEDRIRPVADARTGIIKPVADWASYVMVHNTGSEDATYATQSLIQIRAKDPDEGENAQLSFAIVDGNSRGYFQMNVKDGNITLSDEFDFDNIVFGCHVLKVLVKDLGEEQMSTDAYANIFLSSSEPSSVNQSEAMKECRASPIYPIADGPFKGAGLDNLTIFIIIGFAILIFIILIIIAVILIKCKCCGTPAKSRSYNCQQGNNIYSSPIYGKAGKKNRNKAHRRPGMNGQGTVDSRSSFHSEWTASQTQIAQEKMDLVGALPALHSEGSVGSHNSGRDSGTGDSMPSDAYHALQPHTVDMGYPVVSYNPRYPNYPLHHQANPNMPEAGMPMDGQYPGNGMMTTKCTEECLVYGHSDACWMPDSLLRPPSRMTSFKQQESDEMKTPVRNLNHMVFQHPQENDAGDLRYQTGDPSTPYYYDPGRKFVHSEYPGYPTGTAGRNFSTFRDEHGDEYAVDHPHGSQAGSHAGSQAPSGLSAAAVQNPNLHPSQVYPGRGGQYGRGRAYVNLQGYDPNAPQPGQTEEAHSNLSSASSNTNPYPGGFSHNKQPHYREPARTPTRYPAYQEPRAYYDPISNPGYPAGAPEFHPAYPDQGHPAPYEEDYSASNLLLSPTDNDPDYRQPWERRMPAQGPGYFSPTSHYGQNAGNQMYANNREEEERQNLIENRPDVAIVNKKSPSNDQEDDGAKQTGQDGKTVDEKLSTIEEIDAEAVVAEIDGLLL